MAKKPKKEKFNISFKKERETGLAAVGNPYPTVHIKVNKLEVGYIDPPNWKTKDNLWRLRLQVEDTSGDNSNCDWKWIRLKITFEREDEARAWLKENLKRVHDQYTLHFEEPDE